MCQCDASAEGVSMFFGFLHRKEGWAYITANKMEHTFPKELFFG